MSFTQKENADVNCDGTPENPKITPADAQAIFDKYLGRNELPCSCSEQTRAASAKISKQSIQREFVVESINPPRIGGDIYQTTKTIC